MSRCPHLTLVAALVLWLHPHQLQGPLVAAHSVQQPEPARVHQVRAIQSWLELGPGVGGEGAEPIGEDLEV